MWKRRLTIVACVSCLGLTLWWWGLLDWCEHMVPGMDLMTWGMEG